MSTKHTPGPWHSKVWSYQSHTSGSDRGGQWRELMIESKTDTVCRIESVYRESITESDEIKEANAQLIAAAPDLLAACKAVRASVAAHADYGDIMNDIDILDAAIRKAEGADNA